MMEYIIINRPLAGNNGMIGKSNSFKKISNIYDRNKYGIYEDNKRIKKERK